MKAWERAGRFRTAHAITDAFEGGASNDPNDRAAVDVPPGEIHTFRGIRASTWAAWLEENRRPPKPLTEATASEILELYFVRYWLAAGCDRYAAPLDLVMFDAAVNHGPARAVTWLQTAVGALLDGKPGPQTAAFAAARDPDHTAEHVLWTRTRFFAVLAGDPKNETFIRGWIGRVLTLRFRYVWATRRRPDSLPHRTETALWIDLREAHARAADRAFRFRLPEIARDLYRRRGEAWADRMSPAWWAPTLDVGPLPGVTLPPRPLKKIDVGSVVGPVFGDRTG